MKRIILGGLSLSLLSGCGVNDWFQAHADRVRLEAQAASEAARLRNAAEAAAQQRAAETWAVTSPYIFGALIALVVVIALVFLFLGLREIYVTVVNARAEAENRRNTSAGISTAITVYAGNRAETASRIYYPNTQREMPIYISPVAQSSLGTGQSLLLNAPNAADPELVRAREIIAASEYAAIAMQKIQTRQQALDFAGVVVQNAAPLFLPDGRVVPVRKGE